MIHDSTIILSIAAKYGCRWDRLQAAQSLKSSNSGMSTTALIEKAQYPHLNLPDAPEADLLICTGCGSRIRNFMLWQCAYIEVCFIPTFLAALCPYFSPESLDHTLVWYAKSDRLTHQFTTSWPIMHNALSLFPWPALVACGVALLVAVLLVVTQQWHGNLSTDSTFGVQKFHTFPTPRVGGIAIAAGILVGYALSSLDRKFLLGPLVLAGIPAFAFGLLEDLTKRVSVRTRLLATMACGPLGWALTGYSITAVNVPGLDWLLGFTVFSVLFTAFAVGGVANAINIIDGFNGLAIGAIIVVLTSFGFMATALGDSDLAYISLIFAGAAVGFGLVNWPSGKIFLGDGGAYFIGFALAWQSVLMLARHPEISAWAPLLVCGYPILEVFFSIVRRHRRGGSPGDADRLHLHSLVYRRLVRSFLPRAGNLVRNSATGAVMWMAALLPAAIAVRWPTNTPALMLGFAVCALLYLAVYARLTQFRWAFGLSKSATAVKVT